MPQSPPAPDRTRARSAARTAYGPYGIAVLLYVVFRELAVSGSSARRYLDSGSYLEVATEPIFSRAFLAGIRPWTAPLLYELLPSGDRHIVAAQVAVSVVCWIALAAATASCVRPGAYRLVTFCVVLAFSTSVQITKWDSLVLSESLAVSFTAAVLAAWLTYVRRPRPLGVALILVTTLLWLFTRDSLLVVVVAVALVVAVWAVAGPRRLERAVLCVGLFAVAAAGYASSNSDDAALRRRERVLLHVYGHRVLDDPSATSWFVDHGMPEPSERVRDNRGRLAAFGHGLPRDPQSDVYLRWVTDHGRTALAEYLLTHPRVALEPLVKDHDTLFGAVPGYDDHGPRVVLFAAEVAYVWPAELLLPVLVVVIGGAAWVARRHGGGARWWVVPLVGMAVQIPHAVVVWQGDTLDVARHALLVGVSLRVCALLLVLFAISAVLDHRG